MTPTPPRAEQWTALEQRVAEHLAGEPVDPLQDLDEAEAAALAALFDTR